MHRGFGIRQLRRLRPSPLCPLYVDSSRPECANSGHSRTTWQTRKVDPRHAFKMGPMNGRKRRESGRRRYGQDTPRARVPDADVLQAGYWGSHFRGGRRARAFPAASSFGIMAAVKDFDVLLIWNNVSPLGRILQIGSSFAGERLDRRAGIAEADVSGHACDFFCRRPLHNPGTPAPPGSVPPRSSRPARQAPRGRARARGSRVILPACSERRFYARRTIPYGHRRCSQQHRLGRNRPPYLARSWRRIISPMPFKLVGDGELIRGQGSLGWLPRIFLSADMS